MAGGANDMNFAVDTSLDRAAQALVADLTADPGSHNESEVRAMTRRLEQSLKSEEDLPGEPWPPSESFLEELAESGLTATERVAAAAARAAEATAFMADGALQLDQDKYRRYLVEEAISEGDRARALLWLNEWLVDESERRDASTDDEGGDKAMTGTSGNALAKLCM